jgi:hypothetical protein
MVFQWNMSPPSSGSKKKNQARTGMKQIATRALPETNMKQVANTTLQDTCIKHVFGI